MGKRIAAIVLVYFATAFAWLILGGVTLTRSDSSFSRLSTEVAGLWGDCQVQQAPQVEFGWWTTRIETETVTDPVTGKSQRVQKEKRVFERRPVILDSSRIQVDFNLDHRQKGLLWYSTYLVDFKGEYSYTHQDDLSGFLIITYRFPTTRASYDDFQFAVNGVIDPQLTPEATDQGKGITQQVPVVKGQQVPFTIAYKSRGLDFWRYSFGTDVNRIKDFNLKMRTDFDAIDFPEGSMSPTTKTEVANGWDLEWKFSNLISGFDIGMDMPKKLNPGPLAAQISFFAPINLLFFFVWIFVISLLRKVDLHPMHYVFMAAAFFSFHLLFIYTVDHIALLTAFIISSAVSVFLVVSYLRLAVGMRFAAVEAGLAQVLYLVLFSYAHFYRGWTGLIITIGSIATLFVIMQLTGRINWTEKFAKKPGGNKPGPSAQTPTPATSKT